MCYFAMIDGQTNKPINEGEKKSNQTNDNKKNFEILSIYM